MPTEDINAILEAKLANLKEYVNNEMNREMFADYELAPDPSIWVIWKWRIRCAWAALRGAYDYDY
jgi:hypothetical protein